MEGSAPDGPVVFSGSLYLIVITLDTSLGHPFLSYYP